LAITKETKVARTEQYKELLEASQAIVLAKYSGLTVKQMSELRARLREQDATFQVIKNTLLQRALHELGQTGLDELLTGPVAVGYLGEGIPAAAKVLVDFAKESKVIEIKGGLMGDRVLAAEDIVAVSSLPTREELLAQLVSRLQGPIYGLVSVLSGPMRGLAYVLKARQDQLAETAA
jgi:large subunit ribosomal protein L10